MHYELIPQYWIELNEEVRHHPPLIEKISGHHSSELIEKLGTIAAYVDILIDGYYQEYEIEKIINAIIFRLKAKRSQIINT